MSGGFVERELAVARGLASCRGDDARLDEADAEIAKLRAESDALLALIVDDGFAASFQTMAQYRSALLNSVKGENNG